MAHTKVDTAHLEARALAAAGHNGDTAGTTKHRH
jgi:hypothetical protein